MVAGRDDSIWIACAGQGFVQLKNGGLTNWAIGNGPDVPSAFGVYEDAEGTVWANSTGGIARLKNGRVRLITKDDGLFDNVINGLVLDDQDRFWAHGIRGVFSVTRQALNDFADGRTNHVQCAVYDSLNAVKSVERNQQKPSGCKSLDGRIWFPMAQGLMMIDPTNIMANAVPPQVHVEAVRANGRELDNAGNAALKPGKGELEFEYAGLSYIAPLKIQYRYKLEGYEKDWVEAGNRRSAFYTNLKPGSYRFLVQAGNEDGIWNTTGAEFALQLLPHYYQTAWFDLVCGAAALAALAGFFDWRVRHYKRKQRALQEAGERLENEVASRTAELATANALLQHEEAQLKQRTQSLEKEIEERKRVEKEAEQVHRQLVDASRQAGMAEVATSVLHNVGNVLNSVNVSSSLVSDAVRKSRVVNLAKAVALLEEHKHDLGRFLAEDARGKQLPAYLSNLAGHLAGEREEILKELSLLTGNIEHIKEIVAMQQSYGRVSGVLEPNKIVDLVEDALRMNAGALDRHQVKVIRDYQQTPVAVVDKHKVLQILVNLIRNAKYALDDGMPPVKHLTLRVTVTGDERVRIAVIDNGVGIPAENLTRIFEHGFTTRKDGHGYGLHSGALAARELGGTLAVQSDGSGKGATFTLEFPRKPGHAPGA
jgi:signal transduction histidine kinase